MKRFLGSTSGHKSTSGMKDGGMKRSIALEARVLLDAAAVETAVAVAAADVHPVAEVTTASQPHEVVFVDGTVPDLAKLLQSIDLAHYDVHILDSSRNGLEQMADILSATQGVTSVHVISHAADGAIQLGNLALGDLNLSSQQDVLARLGGSLASGADILLYGCNVAQGDVGKSFVDALAGLTGKDVAASDDVTGMNGDWSLEYQHGLVETTSLSLPDYDGDLNLDGVLAGTVSGATQQEFGSYVDADGAWVVVGGGTNNVQSVTTWIVSGTSRTPFTVTRPDATNWSTSFGQGVAIDAATETLVIADPNAGTYGKLAVYKLQRDANNNITGWGLVQTIVVSGTGRIGAWTGGYGNNYIAISGNHIIVGAPNEGSDPSGRVFWYSDSSSGAWSTYNSGYIDEPESLHEDTGERFGAAVALAGDYLVIGAPGADTNGNDGYLGGGNTGNQGRVYLYQWTTSSANGPGGAANGGTSATRYTTSSWSHLSGQDDMNGLDGGNGLTNQYFGASLAMDYYNGVYTLAIGAPGDGSNDGKVYIYQSTTSDMSTLGYNVDTSKDGAIGIYNLSTSNAASRAGSAVDVSQGRIIVGAYNHTTTAQNAIWYFEAPNNNWNALQSTNNDVDASVAANFTSKGITFVKFTEETLNPALTNDRNGGNRLGYSVALAGGNTVVVGSPRYNSGAANAVGAVDFLYMHTPVATNDTTSMTEDANTTGYLSIDILANDLKGTETVGTSIGTNTFVVSGISVSGAGDAYWDSATGRLMYRQGEVSSGVSNYNYLAQGQSAAVVISYMITGNDFSSSATVTITITGANDNPVYVSGSIPSISGNRTIDTNGSAAGGVANGGTVGYYAGDPSLPSYQIQPGSFSDVDLTDTLTYSLDLTATNALGNPAALAAANLLVSGSGLITWNLPASLPTGTYNIVIKATDNNGGSGSGTVQFIILRDDIRPETVSASLPASSTVYWTQNAASTQSVQTWFRDVDTTNAYSADEALSYSVSYSGPGAGSGWLSIRSDTGLLQGTPTNDHVGNTSVTVTATDKYGQRVSYTFTLTVRDINDAPQLNGSVDPLQAGQGTAFSYQIPGFSTAGSSVNQADDLFIDPDNPGSTISYTAELVDANGNLIRALGAAASGSGAGSWLTFSGGTYNAVTFATTGTATFGGTSTDAIGTKLYVRIKATDSGTSWNGTAYASDPQASTYTFTIQTFAPTITVGPGFGGSTAAELGTAVAISRDGLYMVAGAPNQGEKGSVTTYFWNGSSWAAMTTAFTVPTAVVNGDRFGQSVALDYNGDRLLVSATGANNGAGVVYAFTRTGGAGTAATWTLANTYAEAGSGNTANAGDGFGLALAFYTDSNNTNDGQSFIVGAPYDSDGNPAAGKAFLYGWSTTTATVADTNPVATLVSTTDGGSDTTAYDLFGYSVAFSGDIAVIGAPYDTHDGYFAAGSVAIVQISNPNTTTPTVGASAKLTLGAASDFNDMFGYSVSLVLFDGIGNAANVRDSALLAVGTPGRDVLASDSGAVYLYRADNLVAQTATRASVLRSATSTLITAYDGAAFQYFGSAVAVSVANLSEATGTNRLLTSSQQTADKTGSVYMFKYTTAWNGQRFVPTGTGTVTGMQFGRSLDMAVLPVSNNPNWVVGAPMSGTTAYDGRVYTGTASQATALSLASGGGGELIPMDGSSSSSSASSQTTGVPVVSESSYAMMPMSVEGASASSMFMLSMMDSASDELPVADELLADPSQMMQQAYSDLLLMDMLSVDPLSANPVDAACPESSTECSGSAGGLTYQLQKMRGRTQFGAQSFIEELEKLTV
ncbi:MAG: DUF4347 domain-containing protein [Pedobacter sp.]|nr:DUF4347 domain-containing protein [Pedobacter sp.]